MWEEFGAARTLWFYIQPWVSPARGPSNNAGSGSGSAMDTQWSRVSYQTVEQCSTEGRDAQTVVANLDGTLTRSRSSFPYFMLVAYEAGSPLRALCLLLLSPLIWFLYHFVSEVLGIRCLIFVSFVGLKASSISLVGRAVLCKFYLEDMHPHSYKVFTACGKRYVVTANPRIMVEPFLEYYLGVEHVMGTEVQTLYGYCTGLVGKGGVLVGVRKRDAVLDLFEGKDRQQPDIGLGDRISDIPFLASCKEAYIVPTTDEDPVPRDQYLRPLVFHDGRLAVRPTPLVSVFIFLWWPVGFVLAIVRLCIGIWLPVELAIPAGALLGARMRVRGAVPMLPHAGKDARRAGMLYVCTHRTLLDPIFLSGALRRPVTAVTYSLSWLSELLSPIKTVRLTRDRERDAQMIRSLLKEGDLVICPEGTTCREPYLLRFSPLFAELTDDICPVSMKERVSMFHGTTARGFKGMDPIYFLMNPCPEYEVTLLDPLPRDQSCSAGKTSIHVANYLQKQMADALGYQCTKLTRKDKYRLLASNDGLVNSS